jgi:hypothetical protein
MRRQHGSALAEFALVWPLVLLTILAAIQIGLWSAASFAARSAALAAARIGASTAGSPAMAFAVAQPVLSAAMPVTTVSQWCPDGSPPRGVWVCARNTPAGFEVLVEGSLSALVPLVPGRNGLPIHADAMLPYERFQ